MARSLPNYVGKWGHRTKQAKSCFLPFGSMSEHLTCKITYLLIRTWGMAHISEFKTHWFPYGKMMWNLHDFTSWLWWLTPSISFIFVTFRDSLKKVGGLRGEPCCGPWELWNKDQVLVNALRPHGRICDDQRLENHEMNRSEFLSLGLRWRCGSDLTRCCSVVEWVRVLWDRTGHVKRPKHCPKHAWKLMASLALMCM